MIKDNSDINDIKSDMDYLKKQTYNLKIEF